MGDTKAVLVIDMLYDFLYGKLACERCREIIPQVKVLIKEAREKNIPVIYVCDSHKKKDEEFNKWPEHAVEGTRGAEIIDELKPTEKDHVVKKTRYSCFYNTKLEKLLKKHGVGELILAGILTNICVQHTAADAFYRNHRTTVCRECTEALDEEAREKSLEFMKEMYNTKIKSLMECL